MTPPIQSRGITGVLTLPATKPRALSIHALLLITAAVVLPAVAHLTGISVRHLLPMHWPVLLVGLCYGWRSGLVVGLAAPSLSYLLSGMPYPVMIPAMTVELATYGALAGLFRERFELNGFVAILLAILGGRLVFIATVAVTGATSDALPVYLAAALAPGLPAALAQIGLLPPAAAWWVRRETRA